MRRGSRERSEPNKPRGRKAATPKRRKVSKALRQRSAAHDGTKTAQLARERNEALEQLSAASEVLNVINSSPGDLQAVFAVILASATRICQAKFGTLYRFDGEKLHFAAEVGAPQDLAEFYRRRGPHLPPPNSYIERVVRTKRPSQTTDYTADAVPGPAARFARAGSTVWVPMLRNDVLVGIILVYRQEVRLFTDRQIALVQNFAAQAVTAIENARLLNELRELLEQQSATADILSVISKSPGDLEQVFQSILENATRLCEARFGNIFQFIDNAFHFAAQVGTPRELAEFQGGRGPFLPVEGGSMDRMMRTKQVIHVIDNAAEAVPTPAARLGGARSTIDVPMVKDGALVGAIAVYRQEVRPFTDKQIELVKNFAAQAVIAIENARLLSELRQRTDDLSEALGQQTATSEVLKTISSSPGDLEPVFETVLQKAVLLCDAKFGTLFTFDGDLFHVAAQFGTPRELQEAQIRRGPFRPIVGGQFELVMQTRHVSCTSDEAAEPVPGLASRIGGARSTIRVPMIKDGQLVGALVIYRIEVRPFNDKQIELLQNFAAQAVIAIENARLLSELRQRTTDLTESLGQQTATSDVLRVISSSPGDLEPVFQAMLENATRICEAKVGNLFLRQGNDFRAVAVHGESDYAEGFRRDPLALISENPGSPLDRIAKTKQVIHIADLREDQSYREGNPRIVSLVETAGARTHIVIPMLKESDLVGAIVIYRQEVRPFSEKQIKLLTNFAAQAVIAIENARLLNELRQRTDDLSEALEQQTATSEVLRVISSSPGDLEMVFQAILENATHICAADFGVLHLYENSTFRVGAQHNLPPPMAALRRRVPLISPGPLTTLGRVAATKRLLHISDYAEEPAYKQRDPDAVVLAELGGARTLVTVPMLKDEELIGAISIYRQQVRPFTDKQIELLQNFANQAVIAIENARLLNELRVSLDQQTATADVLGVISKSPGDLEQVFQSILENATRLCEARFGNIFQFDGNALHFAARVGTPPELAEFQARRGPIRPVEGGSMDRMMRTKQVIHVVDNAAEVVPTPAARLGGARSTINVPMIKDGALVGAIAVYRQEVRPFSDKQIALVQNLAAQAVIAIENARLLNELRKRTDDLTESLQQQTATSEVLGIISSSPGELEPVFQAMLENATRICEANFGVLNLHDNGVLRVGAMHNVPPTFAEWLKNQPSGYRPISGSPLDRVISTKQLSVTVDHAAEAAPGRATTLGGARSTVCVPMIKDEELVGTITIYRQEVRPFTDKQTTLLQNFAAQAVIAIENARLLNELRQRTNDLTQSLEDLRTAQDRLVQTEKLASLGQLTAGIAHEIKNPLNFVNNFSGLSVELVEELEEGLKGVTLDDKRRVEFEELTETLRGNLQKVVQHGNRADAIVKNMLLHSRQGSGEHRPVDINALVEESLNLAYHGARAEKQAFEITLERSFDPAAGQADVFPQDITRVLLNVISNGFYAATKRKAEANGSGYEPTLAAATKDLGDRVEIRIRDNGIGIPPEVKEKLFSPFFTTKPAGEGTGLGLSISHDIIVKQHSGSIEVDTKPGEFTEFRIILPRTGLALIKSG